MTSLERIEANRRNATKSTGPRTLEGKAAVALNSQQHGLRSRGVLLKGESERELTDFAQGLRAQLAPDTELELFLVNRLVATAWRLRRVLSVESALFNGESSPIGMLRNGLNKMQVLSRYEVALERSLFKALHELQRLQAARRGEAVPLPEAVDISISGPHGMGKLALLGKNRKKHLSA
jgi:hypothetical protein